MAKAHFRAMPNILSRNKWAQAGLLLIILAGGMLFFAADRLNTIIEEFITNVFGLDGIMAFAAMVAIALIIATGGYYMMKNLKGGIWK